MNSCNHIFTHECKKVELKPLNHCQTIMMHNIEFMMHNIEFIVGCIQSLRNFSVLKVGQNYF